MVRRLSLSKGFSRLAIHSLACKQGSETVQAGTQRPFAGDRAPGAGKLSNHASSVRAAISAIAIPAGVDQCSADRHSRSLLSRSRCLAGSYGGATRVAQAAGTQAAIGSLFDLLRVGTSEAPVPTADPFSATTGVWNLDMDRPTSSLPSALAGPNADVVSP